MVQTESQNSGSLGSSNLFVFPGSKPVSQDNSSRPSTAGNLALNTSPAQGNTPFSFDKAQSWSKGWQQYAQDQYASLTSTLSKGANNAFSVDDTIKFIHAHKGREFNPGSLPSDPKILSPGDRERILQAWRDETKDAPQLEDDDDDEASGGLSPELLALLEGGTAATILVKDAKKFPSWHNVRKGLDEAARKAKAAERDAEKLKDNAKVTGRGAKEAEQALQAARTAQQTSEEAARIAHTTKDIRNVFLAAQIAEKAASEAAKQARLVEKLTPEAKSLRKNADAALESATRSRRVADAMKLDFGGVRRIFEIFKSVGKSTAISFVLWRAVEAGLIYATSDKQGEARNKEAIDALLRSPFSPAATKHLENHEYGEFAQTVVSDVLNGAYQTGKDIKEFFDRHPPAELVADIQSFANFSVGLYELSQKDPVAANILFRQTVGDVAANLPTNAKELNSFVHSLLTDKRDAGKVATNTLGTLMNDEDLLQNAAKLHNEMPPRPPARTPAVRAETPINTPHDS